MTNNLIWISSLGRYSLSHSLKAPPSDPIIFLRTNSFHGTVLKDLQILFIMPTLVYFTDYLIVNKDRAAIEASSLHPTKMKP